MNATITNLLSGEEIKVHSTTEHPCSSYGMPVWVDDQNNCYGQVGYPILGYSLEKEKSIDEIADENGLKTISTTEEMNGYPLHEKQAIIGFENFNQAEELAKEYNLEIQIFKKRDGWDLWHRTGNTAYREFERDAEEYGDDYMAWSSADAAAYNEFAVGAISDVIGDMRNLDDAQELIDKYKRVLEKIESAGENKLIITRNDDYYDTVEHYTMQYEYDTHHWAIGLIEA